MFGLTQGFPSLALSGVPVRLAQFISEILYLTCDAALLAANALVGSHLENCNSLF